MAINFHIKKFVKKQSEEPQSNWMLMRYVESIKFQQSASWVSQFLSCFNRTEYYIYERNSHVPCACIFLVVNADLHYGKVIQVLANFTEKRHEGNIEIKRLVRWAITDFNKQYDAKFYQRSKHVGEHKQLIITKEV